MTMLTLNFKRALSNFTLSIDQQLPTQGITGIFGRSGSGKSSLLRIIAGLDRPDSGELRFRQQTLFHHGDRRFVKPEQRDIGLVFQNNRLFPHLSVRDNLLFAHRRCQRQQLQLDDIINLTQIAPLLDKASTLLSGGEQQRVALARALLNEPQLLLLDEPLSALDYQAKGKLLTLIRQVQQQLAMPMLYVSHSLSELQYLADNLLVLEQGRITDYGNVHQVIHRLNHSKLICQQTSLAASVCEHRPQHGLTTLALDDQQQLHLPCQQENGVNIGDTLRCFIPASDVSVTLARENHSSIVNHLAATVVEIDRQHIEHSQSVLLVLACGKQPFYARISGYSCEHLALARGSEVYLQFKASAVRTINNLWLE